MVKNVPHDAQHVPATLLWRYIPFDAVCVQNQTNFIAVSNCGEGQHAGHLRGKIVLGHRAGSEISRSTDVNHQKQGELTLLRELLDERTSGTSRNVPVDGPNLVPRAVFAYLVEVHSPAFEHRVVGARHTVIDHAASADLQLTHAAAHRLGRFLHVRHPKEFPRSSPSDLRCANGDTAQPAKTTLFAGGNRADIRKSATRDFFPLTRAPAAYSRFSQ